MAYNYEDSEGWLSLGPNINGMKVLLDALKNVDPKLYPRMQELLSTGSTDYPALLKEEAQRLAAKIKDKDVKDTLLKMAKAAARAKGYLMTTH